MFLCFFPRFPPHSYYSFTLFIFPFVLPFHIFFVFLFFSSQCYLFNSYFFLQYTSFYWCYQLYFPPFILRRSSLIIGYAFHIIVIFLLSSPTDLLILHFLFFLLYFTLYSNRLSRIHTVSRFVSSSISLSPSLFPLSPSLINLPHPLIKTRRLARPSGEKIN